MREVKFRVPIIRLGIYAYFNSLWEISQEEYSAHHYNWDQSSQYTGLKDKNDIEIYEGDIVKIDISAICEKQTVDNYEIVWNQEITLGFGWGAWNLNSGTFLPLNGFGEYEVIGNLYENPGLKLEKKL